MDFTLLNDQQARAEAHDLDDLGAVQSRFGRTRDPRQHPALVAVSRRPDAGGPMRTVGGVRAAFELCDEVGGHRPRRAGVRVDTQESGGQITSIGTSGPLAGDCKVGGRERAATGLQRRSIRSGAQGFSRQPVGQVELRRDHRLRGRRVDRSGARVGARPVPAHKGGAPHDDRRGANSPNHGEDGASTTQPVAGAPYVLRSKRGHRLRLAQRGEDVRHGWCLPRLAMTAALSGLSRGGP